MTAEDAIAADVDGLFVLAGNAGSDVACFLTRTTGLFSKPSSSSSSRRGVISQQFFDFGAKNRLATTGNVEEGAAVIRRELGSLREQGPHAQVIWLIHGFADRSRDSDSVFAQGGLSPSRRASQARANRQSRLSVLADAPSTLAVSSMREPGVIAELDDLSQPRVFCLKLLDGLIQGEQIAARRLNPGHSFGQVDAPSLPSVLEARLTAGLFDQNLTHRLRGRAEKWRRPSQPGSLPFTSRRYASWTNAVGWRVRPVGKPAVSDAARRRSSS